MSSGNHPSLGTASSCDGPDLRVPISPAWTVQIRTDCRQFVVRDVGFFYASFRLLGSELRLLGSGPGFTSQPLRPATSDIVGWRPRPGGFWEKVTEDTTFSGTARKSHADLAAWLEMWVPVLLAEEGKDAAGLDFSGLAPSVALAYAATLEEEIVHLSRAYWADLRPERVAEVWASTAVSMVHGS